MMRREEVEVEVAGLKRESGILLERLKQRKENVIQQIE